MPPSFQPSRTVLYVPASNEKAVSKALTENGLGADWIIFDLEDAVHPDKKDQARETLRQRLSGLAGQTRSWRFAIRINALDSAYGTEDVLAALALTPDAIVLPKVDGPDRVDALLSAFEASDAPESIKIWAMVESPKAVLQLENIVRAAERDQNHPTGRLTGLLLGTNDLALESGVAIRPGRAAYHSWFMHCILVARAYQLVVIDGVFNDLSNAEGFEAECRDAATLGFDGKSLIHPKQVAPCRAAFSPSAEDVAEAEAIVAAFADQANAGQGVLTVDGKMVEDLHLRAARKILAKADRPEQ